ncbi:MAG: hypothetical protein EOO01_37675 [Chitinophagaceae bacterium]|nr:MAG: hypothetical protein EOO01_37675 [Chitinophagaceae bacterium]
MSATANDLLDYDLSGSGQQASAIDLYKVHTRNIAKFGMALSGELYCPEVVEPYVSTDEK